jgi:hypothetical protein
VTPYEVFGLDFLVDDGLVPWLLEVNATPSLAVEHRDIQGEWQALKRGGGGGNDTRKLSWYK